MLKYWTEVFENDLFHKDQLEQESSINLASLQCALNNLKEKDWKTIKEGLVQISNCAKYSPYKLDEHRTTALTAVLHHIDNPSVITRHAVQSLKDMVFTLGSFTDKDWEKIFVCLLTYYAIAPSKNMMNVVEDMFNYIIDEIEYRKSALMLTTAIDKIKHKKSTELAAKLLKKTVVELGSFNILIENDEICPKILKTAAILLVSPSHTTRYYGKKIFCVLMISQPFYELLKTHVPPELLFTAEETIKLIKSKGVGRKFKQDQNASLQQNKKIPKQYQKNNQKDGKRE